MKIKIRLRLSLLFAVLSSSVIVLFTIGFVLWLSHNRRHEFKQLLEERALNVAQLYCDTREDNATILADIIVTHPSISDEDIGIYGSSDSLLFCTSKNFYRVKPVDLGHVRINRVSLIDQPDGRERLSFYYKGVFRYCVIVIEAKDIIGFERLSTISVVLLFGVIVSFIVVVVLGFIFSYRSLFPLRQLVMGVGQIDPNRLSERLTVPEPDDEIKHLTLAFNHSLDRLEKAFLIQKSFVSNASHEIRTPLTVVRGELELLLMNDREGGSELKRSLGRIYDVMLELSGITDSLLSLAQIEGDERINKRSVVRIDELCLEAIRSVNQRHKEWDIDIDIESFPEDPSLLELYGDSSLLILLFRNLIVNGCKYSSSQPVMVRFVFQEERVGVRFEDQGIGILPEERELIFEPFFRGSKSRSVSGSGLGLAICKRVASLHSAIIDIESNSPQGSVFIVWFKRDNLS